MTTEETRAILTVLKANVKGKLSAIIPECEQRGGGTDACTVGRGV